MIISVLMSLSASSNLYVPFGLLLIDLFPHYGSFFLLHGLFFCFLVHLVGFYWMPDTMNFTSLDTGYSFLYSY